MKLLIGFCGQVKKLIEQSQKLDQNITNKLEVLFKNVEQQIENVNEETKGVESILNTSLPTTNEEDNGFLFAKFLTELSTIAKEIEIQIIKYNRSDLNPLKKDIEEVIKACLKNNAKYYSEFLSDITTDKESNISLFDAIVVPASSPVKGKTEQASGIKTQLKKILDHWFFNSYKLDRFNLTNANDLNSVVDVITLEIFSEKNLPDSEYVHIVRFCGNNGCT